MAKALPFITKHENVDSYQCQAHYNLLSSRISLVMNLLCIAETFRPRDAFQFVMEILDGEQKQLKLLKLNGLLSCNH